MIKQITNLNSQNQNGQSLIELLIAIGIGAIIIIAGVTATVVYLRVSSQDITYQGATFLAQELVDNVTVAAEGDWYKIANASNSVYYLATSTTGFVVNNGSEARKIDELTYFRSFFATSTCRSAADAIGACGADDPSTKKIKITVDWQYRGATSTVEIEQYVTRTSNSVLWQTDWVGGATCPGSDGPVVSYNTRFCSSTLGVDSSSTPGLLKIRGL